MRAKKHLGQHFLRDQSVINRTLDALEAANGERFVEIGPGPATLTMPFSQRGFPLTVVEYDADMVAYLQEQNFPQPIEIISGDFMDVDLETLIPSSTKIFSNLPYNVSVPITARLLPFQARIPMMVFMYQKEVALRVRAAPHTKDYGPISILCALYYEVDWWINVKPGAFYPPPKVQSQVIRLRRLKEPLLDVQHIERFTQLLRFLFNHRRKMIGSNLKRWSSGWTTRETLIQSLEALGFSPTLRPENLSVENYVAWFHALLSVQ